MQWQASHFIEYALAQRALKLGEFKLKSGRISPYFFNAGVFYSGQALTQLGHFYAHAIHRSGIAFDTLFGPAYKGIPLVCATAISLQQNFGLDKLWCFNRKEAKSHGEGGMLVGTALNGRVLIIDDVISAGTAIRNAVDIINQHNAEAVAAVIAFDRQERGVGAQASTLEIKQQFGLEVLSIARLTDLVAHVQQQPEYADFLTKLQHYQRQYGIAVS